MPALKWPPVESSIWSPLWDIAFEIVARGTNRTKLWEIWEYKKFKNKGIFVVLFGVESSQVYGKCSQTRQLALALGERNLNKNTTRHNTQRNTTRGNAHTVICWYSCTDKDQNTCTYAHTDIHVISGRVRVPLTKVVQCHFLKTNDRQQTRQKLYLTLLLQAVAFPYFANAPKELCEL